MRRSLTKEEVIKVAVKDNGKCQKCGTTSSLHIHHIDKNHENNSIENLTILCEFCHRLVHSNKGEKIYYDEENLPKGWEFVEDFKVDTSSYKYEIGWNLGTDSTDHFDFTCPKCKCKADIIKVELHGLLNRFMPCFYYHLKCNRCKLKGQRKCYLSESIIDQTGRRK